MNPALGGSGSPWVDPQVDAVLALHVLPEAVIGVAADGVTCTLWNAAAQELLGWTAEEVVGQPLPTLPVDTLDRRAGIMAKAVRGESDEHLDTVTSRRHRDGHRVEVRLTARPVRDAEGVVTGWVGVLREARDGGVVSAAGRSRLVASVAGILTSLGEEREARRLIDRVCDAVVELLGADVAMWGQRRADGDFDLVRDGGLMLADRTYSAEEGITGRLLAEDRRSLVAPLADFPHHPAAAGLAARGVRLLAGARGESRGGLAGTLTIGWNDLSRIVTPTELFALELLATETAASLYSLQQLHAAAEAQAHERAVADARTDGTAVLGPQGQVLGWNPAAALLTGLPADQVLGGPMPFPVPGPGTRREVALPGERWLEVATSSVDGYGESVVDFRDVTGPKREERAKDLFLATASHELRTPITVIQGFSGTLLNRWDDLTDGERREAVATIAQRSSTLSRLVEQLLLGSRVGMSMSPHTRAFRLTPALRLAVAGFEGLGDTHRITLEVPTELPDALGDPDLLDTVVGQLLENAVKYSPDGGEVTITAGVDPPGRVRIDVADRGIGVPEADVLRIFERFVQSSEGSSDRRDFSGVGLGLYIVRRLMEAQGGQVQAARREGGGSVFSLWLPVAD